MRQRQSGSKAAPRHCWRQHLLLLEKDGFHRRTTCLAHTDIVAHSELMHRQSGTKAAPVQRQTGSRESAAGGRRSEAQTATFGELSRQQPNAAAAKAVGSGGGDVGRTAATASYAAVARRQQSRASAVLATTPIAVGRGRLPSKDYMFGAYRDVCPYSDLMHQQLGSRPAPVQRQRQTAANRWRAARSAAQAATLGDYTETAAVNFFYFDNFTSIYIYLCKKRKTCRNYICSSSWEKICLHKFVSRRISVIPRKN